MTHERHRCHSCDMTTQHNERVPALTLGWRLKMALAHGDISRVQMAQQLGVDPATVSRWCADRGAPPKRAYLSQWALATDVPLGWLETGRQITPGGGSPVATGEDAAVPVVRAA